MELILKILSAIFGSGKTKQIVMDVIQSQIVGKDGGGISSIVEELTKKGLGDAVQSWVSSGKNLPVNPKDLGDALGSDRLNDLAKQSGLSVDTFTKHLSKLLPKIIDQMTPGGKLPGSGS